jgi:hypothetical protein
MGSSDPLVHRVILSEFPHYIVLIASNGSVNSKSLALFLVWNTTGINVDLQTLGEYPTVTPQTMCYLIPTTNTVAPVPEY